MTKYYRRFLNNFDGINKDIAVDGILQIVRSTPIFILLSIIIAFADLFKMHVFSEIFGRSFDKSRIVDMIFFDIYTFLCLLSLPLLLNKYFFKIPLKELGLRQPTNIITAMLYTILLLLITLPIFYHLFVSDPQMKMVYAVPRSISIINFIFLQLFILPIYYFCLEFFFRGFYFMYLWRKIGWHSYWITEITYMFAHAGKPTVEILISVPVGILLNFLTLKTKSIYPAVVVHTTIAVMVNMLGWL